MRVVTIKEAVAMDYGEKVPSFKARVKSIVAQSSGSNDHGDWTIQNVTVTDLNEPKHEIKLKLFDQAEIPQNWKGKTIYVISGNDDKKGGICDVTVMQDTYKWKEGTPEKKMIEVRKRADVALDDGKQQKEEAPAQKQTTQTQQPNQTQQRTAQEPASTKQPEYHGEPEQQPAPKKTSEQLVAEDKDKKRKAIKEAAKYCARRTNAFRMIFRALDKLVEERQAVNRPLTEGQMQGLLAQIYIGGDRGIGVWNDLPTTKEELEELWPQPKQQKKSQTPDESASD